MSLCVTMGTSTTKSRNTSGDPLLSGAQDFPFFSIRGRGSVFVRSTNLLSRLLRLGAQAKAVVAAGVIVTSGSSAVLPAESSLRISVYVYNGARVPARTLRKAQYGAAKIFEKGGRKSKCGEPRPPEAEQPVVPLPGF